MKRTSGFLLLLSSVVVTTLVGSIWLHGLNAQQTSPAPGSSPQVTGTPGLPGATTTINGQQLPPPPQKFGGKIERNVAESTPY